MAWKFLGVNANIDAELGSGGLGLDSGPCSGVDEDLMGIIAFVFSEGLVKAAGFRIYVFAPVIGKGADDGKCALISGKISCELESNGRSCIVTHTRGSWHDGGRLCLRE